MKDPKTFQIRFDSIDLASKEVKLPKAPIESHDDINFHFTIDLKLSTEKKAALVITDISLQDKRNNNEDLASFKLFCVFTIADFENIFIKVNEKRYQTPLDLEIILKSAGLSTMRGIIYSELRGTYLQNVTLPLIDIAAIIKTNREKNIESKNELKSKKVKSTR